VSRGRTALLLAVGAISLVLATVLATLVTTGGGNRPETSDAAAGPGGAATDNSTTQNSAPPVGSDQQRELTAGEAAETFLSGYVDPDGRVVRRDQGGDTVSEGQAYALLIAAGIGDRESFTEVWSWTQDNLQRADGLLSWRWEDGAVVDASSAADADLDTARALVLAGTAFDDPQLTADGVALGLAVLDLETVQTGVGRVLVAGSWATVEPYAYNPSYASPAASAVLAQASGDPRWAELDEGSRAATAALLEESELPPDWAQVRADGTVEAMPGAQGRGNDGVRYSYDATRTPVRFAESCASADRALAARLVDVLDRSGADTAVLDLGGAALTGDESAVAAVGQAAAVAAGGDLDRARVELVDADHLQQRAPTYYGAAWNALGRLLLTDEALGGCPPLVGAS
jgi:endoglucanase